MTHADAEQQDLVDRYLRGELPGEVARAFEDHYFTCDACFEAVRAIERLRIGVHGAAGSGRLDASAEPAVGRPLWMRPLVALPLAATLLLTTATGWLGLVLVPELRRELAGVREEVQRQAALVPREQPPVVAPAPAPAPVAEANIPVAIVQTTRDAAAPIQVAVPAGARHVVLWIEAPAAGAGTYRLVLMPAGATATTAAVEGLVPNAEGALAAALPAASLQPGRYAARLYRVASGRETLAGEYLLSIVRPR